MTGLGGGVRPGLFPKYKSLYIRKDPWAGIASRIRCSCSAATRQTGSCSRLYSRRVKCDRPRAEPRSVPHLRFPLILVQVMNDVSYVIRARSVRQPCSGSHWCATVSLTEIQSVSWVLLPSQGRAVKRGSTSPARVGPKP
jgi:hypothetical protein